MASTRKGEKERERACFVCVRMRLVLITTSDLFALRFYRFVMEFLGVFFNCPPPPRSSVCSKLCWFHWYVMGWGTQLLIGMPRSSSELRIVIPTHIRRRLFGVVLTEWRCQSTGYTVTTHQHDAHAHVHLLRWHYVGCIYYTHLIVCIMSCSWECVHASWKCQIAHNYSQHACTTHSRLSNGVQLNSVLNCATEGNNLQFESRSTSTLFV